MGSGLGRKYNSGDKSYRKQKSFEKKVKAKEHSSAINAIINMIVGGFYGEYPTLGSFRDSIHTLIKRPPKENPNCLAIKFDEKISQPLQQPHTNPIVVTIRIAQIKVRRVLVNSCNMADLITMDSLRHMKYEEKNL